MHRLSLLVLKAPVVALLTILLVSVLAGLGVLRLELDDGMHAMFAGDSPEYRAYDAGHDRFTPTENDIAVLFRSDDLADPDTLRAIREFSFDAALAVNVEDAFSIFSLHAPPDADGGMKPLLPDDLDTIEDLPGRLMEARNHPIAGDRLLSRDLRLTMVLVSLEREQSGVEASRVTLDELRRLAADAAAGTGMEISIAGLAPLRQIVIDGMLTDNIVLNLIGILIGLLVCWIALRSLNLALMTALPPTMALFWVLGGMGWLGLHINTVTSAVPVLILVLSFCDSLHLTFEVRRQAVAGGATGSSVAEAVRRIGPACAMTSFTTAIAFASLLISQSEIIRGFGWAGILATSISLLAVLCVHPLLFAAVGRTASGQRLFVQADTEPYALFHARPFYRFGFRHHRLIAGVAVAGLALALAAYTNVRPVYSFLENIGPGNAALVAMQTMERDLAPTGSIDVAVTLPEGSRVTEQGLADVVRVHDAISAALPESSIVSLATLSRWVTAASREDVAIRVDDIVGEMTDLQRGRFLSADGNRALIRIFIADQGARATRALVEKVDVAVAAVGLAPDRIGMPTGLLAMSASVSSRMIERLNISFAIAVVSAGLFIALWFGNWRYGLVSLMPNILPIACVGAWLAATGWGLQFSSAIAMTIAFGIAVDDTVHVINRLRLEARPEDPFNREAIRAAFREIAPVLTITTIVLSCGMLASQVSSIPTIAYFGALVIAVFVLALFAVLVVLPACLMFLSGPEER